MVIAVCLRATLHLILTVVQTELLNHDRTVYHQVFYMYSHTWKWHLEYKVYVWNVHYRPWVVIGRSLCDLRRHGNSYPRVGRGRRATYHSLPHCHLSLIHMHTLLKSPSLSQCKNGHYIQMEKRWPWLIILSLNNGSDTFSASMCL